ncbi:hypothetical protein Tco_0961356, partial [Tanacetum coccineum]
MPSGIRSFLGLAGYYQRFIVNLSKIAKPLTSLTQKNKKQEWAKEQEEAFQTLKGNLGKVENAIAKMLRGLNQLIERKEGGCMYLLWVPLIGDVRTLLMDDAHASRYLVQSGADKTYYDLRDMYDGHVFDVLYLKRCMEGSVGHMFFGLKLEKFGRLDQNWYKRQQIRVKVGDKVMLEVSSWKDLVHFGKKEMLAPGYVGSFEIIKGIGPMA